MYFEEHEVRRLVTEVIDRLPGVELMFDTIPRWFSRKTIKGFARTKSYTTPRMPWGIDRDEIEPTLRRWTDRIGEVSVVSYGYARGLPRLAVSVFSQLPRLRNVPPSIVRLKTRAAHSG
jgi:O-methyltransferase involved in polyketide biosynthesis